MSGKKESLKESVPFDTIVNLILAQEERLEKLRESIQNKVGEINALSENINKINKDVIDLQLAEREVVGQISSLKFIIAPKENGEHSNGEGKK